MDPPLDAIATFFFFNFLVSKILAAKLAQSYTSFCYQ
jgi:hypothetical protein